LHSLSEAADKSASQQLVNPPISPLVDTQYFSVTWPVSQLTGQSINQSINQSISQPISAVFSQ
jgi:hypothetical protein